MKLHRLFAKIFLWFWLAIILVASAAAIVGAWVQARLDPRQDHLRFIARATQSVPAHVAIDLLQRSGPRAAGEYVEAWRRHAKMQAFILNDQGRAIAPDEPVPPEWLEVVERARQTGQPEAQQVNNRLVAAVPVAAEQGRTFWWVSELPPGPRAGDRGGPPDRPPPPPTPFSVLIEQPVRLGAIVLAVILTGGAVCYWLARYLTRPLETLRAAATQLAQGNLGARVGRHQPTRRDEIGDLARDFDRMAEQLEAQVATQKRLLRDVSHELRSPLARLNIALGIARQQPSIEPGSAHEQCLARIEAESERLNAMIGGVLMLARLESGAQVTRREPVELADLVSGIVQDASFEAQARQVQVRLADLHPCTIKADPELLHRAIENVVRNAVHYAAERTPVEVALVTREGPGGRAAVIAVRNHGPGLPADALEQVFEPFYRVQQGRERATGGTGLGLAITDRAVRAHGGTVAAANADEGGLVVTITLPLSDEASGLKGEG